MTLRGAECLRRAEVVVLDALVDRRVLSHCSPGVKVIEAGKRGGGRVFLRQPAINRLLVRLAMAGKTVVRLKGGDPYFFGRGAEEAEALADRGIPFEVVPGVSSVTSVPGFAGIPLTHRGHASVLTVVTGHEGREKPLFGGKRRQGGSAPGTRRGLGENITKRNVGDFDGTQAVVGHFPKTFGFGMAACTSGGGDSVGQLGDPAHRSRYLGRHRLAGQTGRPWGASRDCDWRCGRAWQKTRLV
jgi:hypothetical protein